MKQPYWKKILSYFVEWHVESAPSDYNPHLYVSLKNGRYQLCTANAVYSYEDLYTNFKWAFEQAKLEVLPIGEVLLLGLGLGSVPQMLEQVFDKRYRYTAVELDEEVIYLANRYVLSGLQSPISTICAEAYSFMLQNEEQYDMVCMDIFLDDTVPRHFESREYLEALRDALSPNGLLLYNRLADKPEDTEKTKAFFERQFLAVFPEGGYLDVGGNWMLFNRREMLK